jgi:hypothetical protein
LDWTIALLPCRRTIAVSFDGGACGPAREMSVTSISVVVVVVEVWS